MLEYQLIGKDIGQKIKDYKKTIDVLDAGQVVASNDGVITVEGLQDVKSNELLRLDNGNFALALNLEEDNVGAIVLNEAVVPARALVYTTGEIVSVPVGEELLGRVINSLGEPLDGEKAPECKSRRHVEFPAPEIMDRDKVSEPLYTGIKAIDSMIPIGKGQRELIIGDRKTGKTTIAIDAILNQKGKDVICVYVAIGQKASTVARIVNTLKNGGALPYTIVVASTSAQSAPMQYLAPYTGTAIAEYFMYKGKDVLIVYDDLTKHAVAYRTISLLLKRPSGREAYPGDVFYIHSRLLERSAKLSKAKGGGSLTALPIVETLAGDISAYIPTNIISITDGQIYLEEELFNAGMRPAVNVGLSVSRVGGSAQVKAMRKVASKVRLTLAHYRETALFSRFGSDVDKNTLSVIEQGERLTEAMKQSQHKPLSMAKIVVTLDIMMKDLLKDVAVKDVRGTLDGFLAYLTSNYPNVIKEIERSNDYTDDNSNVVENALKKYLSL